MGNGKGCNLPKDVSQTELLASGPDAQSGKLDAANTEPVMAVSTLARRRVDFAMVSMQEAR